jgi:hypothetical protein
MPELPSVHGNALDARRPKGFVIAPAVSKTVRRSLNLSQGWPFEKAPKNAQSS